MHLRAPSVDHGVQSFIWAAVFFLFLWFGMWAIGVNGGEAFILALVLAVLIFLFVRIFGEDEPGGPEARRARKRLP